MKIYIAKDWTGVKVFAEPPVLMKCGGMPDIWSGWRLPFGVDNIDMIPKGEYIEKEFVWAIKECI